jgi:hypothetical protein
LLKKKEANQKNEAVAANGHINYDSDEEVLSLTVNSKRDNNDESSSFSKRTRPSTSNNDDTLLSDNESSPSSPIDLSFELTNTDSEHNNINNQITVIIVYKTSIFHISKLIY